jgi:hypothetical protein
MWKFSEKYSKIKQDPILTSVNKMEAIETYNVDNISSVSTESNKRNGVLSFL